MPYIKPISGHTGLAKAKRYLERDGRALASDFLNLDAPIEGHDGDLPRHGEFDWASSMDATRHAAGNDLPWRGERARTYKHYVLSPDPRNNIDLETLRGLAMEWTRENFGDYEVAIVYHDDNASHVPHAHVIVNNTNLVTGRRLQDPDPRSLKRSAQRLAEDRGLAHFHDECPVQVEANAGVPRATYPSSRPRRKVHILRAEAELEAKGRYSWVADIRARVDVARSLSTTTDDFVTALSQLGITVSPNSPKAERRDWVYSLADQPSRRITGEKLGTSYSMGSVARELASPLRLAPASARPTVLGTASRAIELGNLSELEELARAMGTNSRHRISSMADYDRAINQTRSDPSENEALRRAMAFCRDKGILPDTAPTGRPSPSGRRRTRRRSETLAQGRRAVATRTPRERKRVLGEDRPR